MVKIIIDLEKSGLICNASNFEGSDVRDITYKNKNPPNPIEK